MPLDVTRYSPTQMTWRPKSSLAMENLHWISSSLFSVPPHDYLNLWGPWFPKKMKKLLVNGPLINSPVPVWFFLLSLIQEWLDTRNATLLAHFLDTSVTGGSWCTDHYPKFFHQLYLTVFSRLWSTCHQYVLKDRYRQIDFSSTS